MIPSAQKSIGRYPGLHTGGWKEEERAFGGSFSQDPSHSRAGIQLVFNCASLGLAQWFSLLKPRKILRDFSLVNLEDARVRNNQTVLASGILAINFLLDLQRLNKNRLI